MDFITENLRSNEIINLYNKVKDKELFNHILKLFNSIDIPYINYGGCLYSAYAVYRKLELEGKLNSDIAIVQLSSYSKYDIDHNLDFISGNNDKPISSSHFVLTFDGGKTALDSNGIISIGDDNNWSVKHKLNYDSSSEYKYHLVIPQNMTETFSINALTYGGWNRDFCRATGVPMINKILGIDLPIIKNR
jgi:hypothetical protein